MFKVSYRLAEILYLQYLTGDDAVEVSRDVLDREDADAVLGDHANLTIVD